MISEQANAAWAAITTGDFTRARPLAETGLANTADPIARLELYDLLGDAALLAGAGIPVGTGAVARLDGIQAVTGSAAESGRSSSRLLTRLSPTATGERRAVAADVRS
jgi:hypothetical protein